MTCEPETVTVGIAGHLGLDAAARTRVAAAVGAWFRQQVMTERWRRVELHCGLAPGADLVLAEALLQAGPGLGVAVTLRALMVAEADELIGAWQLRATELGKPPSERAQRTVRQRIEALLAQAAAVEQLPRRDGQPDFQRLAARLAEQSQELVCVVRSGHRGKPGGASELVQWRRDPGRIPAELRGGRLCSHRGMLIIDPDTGEVRHSQRR